jgi:hypothetical protein
MPHNKQPVKKKNEESSSCGCLSFLFKPKKTNIELIRERQLQRMDEQNERRRAQIEAAADQRAEARIMSRTPYQRF